MGHSPAPSSATGVLRASALALLGIFLVSVIPRVLPPRLLDPLWQVSLVTALLDMGGYALLGVVVLTVADLLQPGAPILSRQRRRISQLCRFAALGYLLLVPLLVSALARDYEQVAQASQRQIRDIDRMEQRLHQAIQSARSQEELLRDVQRVNAPALSGFLLNGGPLESQRAQAQELLQSTAATARRQAAALSPASLQTVLLNNLRLILLSLVFAFGFASAHAGRLSFPLLDPLQLALQRCANLLLSRHRQRSSLESEQSYFESLAQDDRPRPPL